jgi:serine/threonine-protein kinase RsbT
VQYPQAYVVQTQSDVEFVRREARILALAAGLDRRRAEMVALSVSELATNLQRYATDGRIVVTHVSIAGRSGVEVQSHDHGPGIADLKRAMQDDYSTGGGFGSGLPAVRRLMDEFDINSGPEGTTVTARKWTIPSTT